MAVLETIRNKFGILITVLIAIALLSFIVDPSSLSLFSSNQQNNSGDNITVAEINGENVSYYDFDKEMQLLNGGNADRNSLRSQVMLKFIGEHLYSKNAKAAGLNVSDEELAQVLSGNIYSNIVTMYLGPDMTKGKLAELENNVEKDQSGRMKYWWDNVLSQVRSERYYTKYSEYLQASAFENPLVTEDTKNNAVTFFDVEYICVPDLGLNEYTNIEVTDKEVKEYYEAHKNHYKTPKSRVIDYILVEVDTENEEVVDSVNTVFDKISNAEEFAKAAIDNEYLLATLDYLQNPELLSENDKLIAANENIYKWAYKTTEIGEISTVFYPKDEEKSYMAIAILKDANDSGYLKFENLASNIKDIISKEKAKDIRLAEVKKTVGDFKDMKNISRALGYEVNSVKNVSFAKSDLDKRFIGAVSVAEEGVVNGPLKGDNGIYIYKVANRHEEGFYTAEDAKNDLLKSDAYYLMNYGYYMDPNIMYMMPNPGYINDYTYLYF